MNNWFIKQTLVVLPALLLALTGCVNEMETDAPEPTPGTGRETVFTVNVPGMKAPSTRALDENEVRELDVVVFRTSDNTIREHRRVAAADIVPGTDGNDYRFRIKDLANSEDVTLSVVANASSAVLTALNAVAVNGAYIGAAKKDFLLALRFASLTAWPTGSLDYRPIPMYGETAVAGSIYTGTIPAVNLTRMLAKVDVRNNVAPGSVLSPAAGDFELTAVHVVNYNTAGTIAPEWDASTGVLLPGPATGPNLPTWFDPAPVAWSSGNELTYTLASEQTSIENEIYLFESDALSADPATPDGLRLVFEGNYTDAGGTKSYYYPVDFTYPRDEQNGTTEYMPVLRNNRYLFSITEASGRGYDRLGDAVASFGVMSNLKTSLIVVDESGIRQLVWNGEHFLGVDQKDFTVSRESQEVSMTLATNYANGWQAEILEPQTNDWLRFAGDATATSGSVSDKQLAFNVSAFSPGAGDPQTRTAYVRLSAGRLDLNIGVTQTADSRYSLTLTDENGVEISELLFGYGLGTPIDARTVNVSWTGLDDCEITGVAGATAFVYAADSDTPSGTITGGIAAYNIKAAAASQYDADNFVTKESTLTFTLTDSRGNTLTKQLLLRQVEYAISTDHQPSYTPNGSTYTFNVRSNANWRIKSVTEVPSDGVTYLLDNQGSDNLVAGTVGTMNTGTGTPVSFTLANDATETKSSDFTVVFESADSPAKFTDVAISFRAINGYYPDPHIGWAGSNIYYDPTLNGGQGGLTFDGVDVTDHQLYQGVYFKWGSLVATAGDGTAIPGGIVWKPSEYTATPATWDAIPYPAGNIVTNPPAGKTVRDRLYTYEIHSPSMGLGDICAYLTGRPGVPMGKWRLPTSAEMDTWSDNYYYGSPIEASNYNGTNAVGRYITNSVWPAILLAAGWRDGDGIVSSEPVAIQGRYWTGTPAGSNGYALGVSFQNVSHPDTDESRERDGGYTIRCVREEEPYITAEPADAYVLDGQTAHSFKVKSNTRWAVRSISDPNGILLNSAVQIADIIANQSGGNNADPGDDFTFTLIEDFVSQTGKQFSVTFYDPDGRAADVTVNITGISVYVIDEGNVHLYMWPFDQPYGYSWYDYANVPSGTNSTEQPPAGPQNATPNEVSCAALPTSNLAKPWRLPNDNGGQNSTDSEVRMMTQFFANNYGYAYYGLTYGGYPAYWTAVATGSGDFAQWFNYGGAVHGQGYNSNSKGTVGGRARCVRDQ